MLVYKMLMDIYWAKQFLKEKMSSNFINIFISINLVSIVLHLHFCLLYICWCNVDLISYAWLVSGETFLYTLGK